MSNILFYEDGVLIYRDDPIVDSNQKVPQLNSHVMFKNCKTGELKVYKVIDILYNYHDKEINIDVYEVEV